MIATAKILRAPCCQRELAKPNAPPGMRQCGECGKLLGRVQAPGFVEPYLRDDPDYQAAQARKRYGAKARTR